MVSNDVDIECRVGSSLAEGCRVPCLFSGLILCLEEEGRELDLVSKMPDWLVVGAELDSIWW